jgi:hypothetical protein
MNNKSVLSRVVKDQPGNPEVFAHRLVNNVVDAENPGFC